MPRERVLEELLDIALSIDDDYVRTVTLAKAGYYLHSMHSGLFPKSFKAALKSLDTIGPPLLRLQAMMIVAEQMGKAGLSESSGKLLYRAYELARILPLHVRDSVLVDIVRTACRIRALQDALVYATDIKDVHLRMNSLLMILETFISIGDLRRTGRILDTMEEPWRSEAAFMVLQAHLEREEFASVLRVLPYIKNPNLLERAFREIGERLKGSGVPEGTYEKFIEAAKTLSGRGLDLITTLLATIASTGRVPLVIKALKGLNYPLDSILRIATAIMGNAKVLTEFVDSLDLEQTNAETLYKLVMDSLLSREVSKDYLPLVKNIGRRTEAEETMVKVIRYLTKLGELGEAYGFASMVEDPRLRSLTFGSIAMALLKKGNVSGAIEAVGEVKDKKWNSWLMSEIIIKVLQLYSGEDIKEDFEENSMKQAKRWEENAKNGGDRRLGL